MSSQTDRDDVLFAPITIATGVVFLFNGSPYMGGFITVLGILWSASVFYRLFKKGD